MIQQSDTYKECLEQLNSMKTAFECEVLWENIKSCGCKMIHKKTGKEVTSMSFFYNNNDDWYDKVSIYLDHLNSSRRNVLVSNIRKQYEVIM